MDGGREGASLTRCRAYGWSEVQPKVQGAVDPQNDSPAFDTEPSSRPCKLCAYTSLLLARHSTKQGAQTSSIRHEALDRVHPQCGAAECVAGLHS